MSATIVILARRGSKGVPGKNMADVAGRPCLAWTIDAALASRRAHRVVLSTDWDAAADLAISMGIQVSNRPADLANDAATVDAAVRHAITSSSHADESLPVVILYGNVPVRPADLIDRAVTLLIDSGADSVMSYAPVGKHHPWWTCRVDPTSGAVAPWEGDRLFHATYRRQDLPAAYVPDGGVLAVTRDALFCRVPGVPSGPHAFLGREDRRRAVLTREGDVVDIDSPIDLIVADAMLRGVSHLHSPSAAAASSTLLSLAKDHR